MKMDEIINEIWEAISNIDTSDAVSNTERGILAAGSLYLMIKGLQSATSSPPKPPFLYKEESVE